MATRDQCRAKFALAKVESKKASAEKRKFKTELLKLPARLHTNGLGQTVAFYLSAGPGKPESEICRWLEEWLRPANADIYPAAQSLIHCITGTAPEGEERYRRASAEVRSLAVWLKRFAEAFIEGERE